MCASRGGARKVDFDTVRWVTGMASVPVKTLPYFSSTVSELVFPISVSLSAKKENFPP